MKEEIVFNDVTKNYGQKQALCGINLTVGKGMFGLLGRNGAGKTTLMKSVACLHKISGGSITVCGIPIEHSGEIRSITGYLPQDFGMYPNMTVYECLDYLGTLSGLDRATRRERIEVMLRKVNLTEERNKRFRTLSGGMKRRLGIAQALLHDPKVLIVDEPTAGLDPEERIRFRNLLCEAAEERIVILSTHIVGDIEATCERIAIMNEGRILWEGTVSQLVSRARGKVYTMKVDHRELHRTKKELIVTGMRTKGDFCEVRVISEEPMEASGAILTEPDAEDAYMYCLFQNGCDVKGGEE